jgi:hypothetical protein
MDDLVKGKAGNGLYADEKRRDTVHCTVWFGEGKGRIDDLVKEKIDIQGDAKRKRRRV